MKQLDSTLAGGDSLFRSLLRSAPEALVVVNEAGVIVLTNARAERLFGYSREELQGQPVDLLVPAPYLANHLRHRNRCFLHPRERRSGKAIRLYGLRKNGDHFPVEINLSPLRTGAGILLSGSVRDLTERRRVVRRRSDARFPHVQGVPSGAAAGGALPNTMTFDRTHLRQLTNQLSDNSEDLRVANARLRALVSIGLELASERDSDRLLGSVCEDARDLFGATYATLGIVDRADQTVRRFVTCGVEAADWIRVGDRVSGILGTVVAERRTVRGGDAATEPAFPPLHPEARAFLAAPIASPGRVYGWICVVSNEGRRFTGDDEHMVMALAGQVGRVYENRHVYAMARKRADELEHEIVEREQAEVALRGERDRAQRYLDTADTVLLALDVEGRITLVNRYACSLLEWDAGELLGRDWFDACMPARERDASREAFRKRLGGDSSSVEWPIVTRSGVERLIEWRTTLLREDAGSVSGILSSGTDVTERTQATEALRTAEERMRFVLRNAEVGIWDMDYATGVLRWSETLEAQYGLEPGTFAGTFDAFMERVHADDRDTLLAALGGSAGAGADFSIQHRAVWPDGTVRWVSGKGRILAGERGEPLRGVGISVDVTERRTLELQYQQAQKMEAVGRLAGGVAHDFNNLLTAILGYCELLLADLAADDPRRADVAEIQKAGMSAAGLTRQLLAFSRKEIIELRPLDLNEVLARVRPMLGRLIGEDVSVVLAPGAGLWPVMADGGQVEQVVVNLAVNARDAMPRGGTLTFETANVSLDEGYARTHLGVQPGSYVELTVTDTGTGMDAAVQACLFDPFFTTKEPGKGTGLGLATVHGIVARSGGSVDVYSKVGWGTSFRVYLPRAEAAETAVEAARPPAARRRAGSETVLVVEDAEGLRELTRRLLRREGYTVLVAANADEAVDIFKRTPSIDVLLTDVVMPGASGPELIRQLAEQRPALKVVYMSGYTEETIVRHGVINPGITFLHKPFTSETLGRKMREVLAL